MALRQSITAVLFATLCCWLGATGGARAAEGSPGAVDPSFGVGGVAAQAPRQLFPPNGANGPIGEDMVVGPDDEIFLLLSLQECEITCRIRFFLQRYLPDGTLDETFGREGTSAQVVVNAEERLDPIERFSFGSLAVGSRGEPVVATAEGGDLILFRFDRSGNLAQGFGTAGMLDLDFGGSETRPQVAVLPDERIVVASGSLRGRRSFAILARLLPDGNLDPTFGEGPGARRLGWTKVGGRPPGALAVGGGGAIALAGGRCCSPAEVKSVYVGRRRSDGGPSNVVPRRWRPWRHLRVGPRAWVSSVIALPGGKLDVVGGSGANLFAARLRPSGRLDRSFGRRGLVRFPEILSGASPAVADAHRRLYVAGVRYPGYEYAPYRGIIARVTARGRHDGGWGNRIAGYARLRSITEPLALGFQSDGKLVAFGEYAYECIRTCYLPGWALTRVFTGPNPGRR